MTGEWEGKLNSCRERRTSTRVRLPCQRNSVTDCFSFLFVGEVAAIVAMGGLLQAVSKQTLLNCLQIRGIGNGMVVFFIQNLQIVKVQIGKCIFFCLARFPEAAQRMYQFSLRRMSGRH